MVPAPAFSPSNRTPTARLDTATTYLPLPPVHRLNHPKMAPTKGPSSSNGKPTSKADSKKPKSSATSKVTKSKSKSKQKPTAEEVKSKARTERSQLKKTKKRQYTEDELDLPKLNAITPVGVVTPKGKKKGKVFVDDQVSFFLFFWVGLGRMGLMD